MIKVSEAQKRRYAIEMLADAMFDAKTKLGYVTNEQLLTFHWLYSIQESTADQLTFDMP